MTVDNEGKTFYAQVPAVNKSTQNNSINNVSSLGNYNSYASASSSNVDKNLKRTPRIVGTKKGTFGNMVSAQRV